MTHSIFFMEDIMSDKRISKSHTLEVGKRLVKIRELLNMTQEELSKLTEGKVTRGYISKLESGTLETITESKLKELAVTLGTTVEFLIGESEYHSEYIFDNVSIMADLKNLDDFQFIPIIISGLEESYAMKFLQLVRKFEPFGKSHSLLVDGEDYYTVVFFMNIVQMVFFLDNVAKCFGSYSTKIIVPIIKIVYLICVHMTGNTADHFRNKFLCNYNSGGCCFTCTRYTIKELDINIEELPYIRFTEKNVFDTILVLSKTLFNNEDTYQALPVNFIMAGGYMDELDHSITTLNVDEPGINRIKRLLFTKEIEETKGDISCIRKDIKKNYQQIDSIKLLIKSGLKALNKISNDVEILEQKLAALEEEE